MRQVAVLDRLLLVLLPQAWEEYRARGLALEALDRMREAAQDFETYLAQAQQADDAALVSERLSVLRRTLM